MSIKIEYDYEVTIVDEAARVMEVRYTSDAGEVMHVSIPLPSEGQDVDSLIEMYSPVNYWGEQRRPVTVAGISVGRGGHKEGWYGPRPLTPEEQTQQEARDLLEETYAALRAPWDWDQLTDPEKAEVRAYATELREGRIPADTPEPIRSRRGQRG